MWGNARSSILILNKSTTAMSQDNNQEIDLTSLENIELKPIWANNKEKRTKHLESKKTKKQRRFNSDSKNDRKERKWDRKYYKYKLVVSADQNVLKKIKAKVRETGITYSLTEIVNVICNDPNRLHFKVKGIDDITATEFIFERQYKRYYSNKKDAIDDFLKKGLQDDKITKNLVKEEKPKGKFDYVLECPMTKKLLPPFNLHDNEKIIKQHLYINGITKPYSEYIKVLKKTQEQEKIKEWSQKPIKHYEFMIEKDKESKSRNLDTIAYKLESKYFNRFFRSESVMKFKYGNINNLPSDVRAFTKEAITDKKSWYKGLFMEVLISMKKSKFSVYKINDVLFVSPHKLNKIANNNLSKVASEIINVIHNNKNISRKDLVKNQELAKFDIKDIVLEIRWLIHQGFISIYSDSRIKIT
tara:strand:- start:2531 stop:3775 length:1245 start_codon:yes stop_codon:yes gene_type:complete